MLRKNWPLFHKHGTHTIDWAEKIGLGSRTYELINIDK